MKPADKQPSAAPPIRIFCFSLSSSAGDEPEFAEASSSRSKLSSSRARDDEVVEVEKAVRLKLPGTPAASVLSTVVAALLVVLAVVDVAVVVVAVSVAVVAVLFFLPQAGMKIRAVASAEPVNTKWRFKRNGWVIMRSS